MIRPSPAGSLAPTALRISSTFGWPLATFRSASPFDPNQRLHHPSDSSASGASPETMNTVLNPELTSASASIWERRYSNGEVRAEKIKRSEGDAWPVSGLEGSTLACNRRRSWMKGVTPVPPAI